MGDNQLAVSNYEVIRAMARNPNTIQRFTEVVGSRSNAASYISSAMIAVASSDKLMQCSPSSIFNAVMRSAALRLSCDPSLRQAHLVPFYNNKKGKYEAQFIPGYIGLNNLAQRTGKYRYLQASQLYEGQSLEVDQLTGSPRLEGKRQTDVIIGYFHYFELLTGYKHALYMTVDELKAHGKRYAPKNPMWNTNFHDMAKKTVTRLHLLKDGILDPFDRDALEAAADDIEGEIDGDMIDGTFTEADEAQAQAEVEQKKLADANAPKLTRAEVDAEVRQHNRDMGFDDPEPASVTQPEAPAPAPEQAPDKPAESASEQSSESTPPVLPQRPYDPETLKRGLMLKSEKMATNAATVETQQVAASLSEILGGDDQRHELVKWLTDTATGGMKELTPAYVRSLAAWLKPIYNKNAARFDVDEMALKEATGAHTYVLKLQGQEGLF